MINWVNLASQMFNGLVLGVLLALISSGLTIIYGTLGYVAGRFFHDNFGQVEYIARTISWAAAGIIVVVVASIIIFLWLRHRRKMHQTQQETTRHENNEKVEESVGPTP